MANKILMKSSQDTGDGATQLYNSGSGNQKLSVAELAINTKDGILFMGQAASSESPGDVITAAANVFSQPMVISTAAQAVGTASNVTFANTTVGNLITTGTIDVGHANDTTLTRASAGVLNLQGNGIATSAMKLDHFAATTSAELAGVLSDETGTGAFVLAGSPTLTGNPVATTQTAGNNSTRLATTAYVDSAADAAAAGLQVHADVRIASGTHAVTCGLTASDATVTCSAAAISIGEVVTSAEDGLDSPASGGYYVASINSGSEGVSVTSFELSAVAKSGADSEEVLTFTMDLTPNWTYNAGAGTLLHGDYVNTMLNGSTPVALDRVLLKNQAAALQNGIYIVTAIGNASNVALLLTRDTGMDASADFINGFVFVPTDTSTTATNRGDTSVNDTSWVTTVDTDFTLGTDAITVAQFNVSGNVTAGTNMTKVGNTLNVDDAFLKNNVSDTMSGSLTIAGNILLGSSSVTNDTKELRFVEGANYVGFEAPNLTADQIWILPAADGSSSQMLTTDGNGTLSWSSASSGDVTDVIGGNGLDSDASTGDITLTLNLGELTDTAIAAGDDIVFIDSSNSNASVKGDISDLADLFAGTSLTASSSVISVDDDFVKNTTDTMTDATAGLTTLTIDKNFSATGASTIKGLFVDIDKSASTSSDNTIYGVDIDVDNSTASSGTNVMIGLRATPRLIGAANAGTLTTKGAIITATGDTNGTSVATGMELTATGADTNTGLVINCADGGTDLKLVSSADVTDYATLTVGASGATTLTTVDAGAAIAHLTLTIDGSLIVAGATGIDIGAVNGAGNSPLTNIHIDGGSF